MNTKEKIKDIDGVKWCHCAKHDGFSPCDEFGKDNHSKHKYRSSCKICERMYNLNKEIPMGYVEKYSRIMLTSMGYDVKSKIPIHEQFLIKHNL
jgi:hypothetical protein